MVGRMIRRALAERKCENKGEVVDNENKYVVEFMVSCGGGSVSKGGVEVLERWWLFRRCGSMKVKESKEEVLNEFLPKNQYMLNLLNFFFFFFHPQI